MYCLGMSAMLLVGGLKAADARCLFTVFISNYFGWESTQHL